jgi:hypothetical protein
VVAKDEKPEDKTKRDAEFKDQLKKLTDKLATEKKFEGWVYYLPTYTVDPIIKSRSQLLAETKSEPTEKTGK